MLGNGGHYRTSLKSESSDSLRLTPAKFRGYSSLQKFSTNHTSSASSRMSSASSSAASLTDMVRNIERPESSSGPNSGTHRHGFSNGDLPTNESAAYYRRSTSVDDFCSSQVKPRNDSSSWKSNVTEHYYKLTTTHPPDSLSHRSYPHMHGSSGSLITPVAEYPEGPSASSSRRHGGSKSASSLPSVVPTSSNSLSAYREQVHPAFLSQVSVEFRKRLIVGDRVKDGLLYKDAFLGCEAVDVLLQIIRTNDRNLALLLGRALDFQKLFHDVTYSHRLRDSRKEVYQFRRTLPPPEAMASISPVIASYENHFVYPEKRTSTSDSVDSIVSENSYAPSTSTSTQLNHAPYLTSATPLMKDSDSVEEAETEKDPKGVFTILTDCYSPTCSKNRLCYSISCPRRLEQQARLHMKVQPVLKAGASYLVDKQEEEHRLWSDNVPKHIVEQIDNREWKRQEIIFEIIYTERDFVRDIEYIRDFWIKPLSTSNVIPEKFRQPFIRTVFHNIMQVHAVNSRLSNALNRVQTLQPVVHSVGDIFLDYVPKFEPFIRYGSNQTVAKFEFEREKGSNPAFAKYVHEVERLRESRKLELNGYLTKPVTRLARYPLLLNGVLKYTEKGNPDLENIPKVIEMIREFLTKVNYETGKTENRLALLQLNEQLSCSDFEKQRLALLDDSRLLIFKGTVRLKATGYTNGDTESDIHMFLLDNYLLLTKLKLGLKREQHKLQLRPLPLELLVISCMEDVSTRGSVSRRPSSTILTNPILIAKGTTSSPLKSYGLQLQLLGTRGFQISLYLSTLIARDQWKQHIERQQQALFTKHLIFETIGLCNEAYFYNNKITSAVTYDAGRKLVFGSYRGLYVSSRKGSNGVCLGPRLKIPLTNITQVDLIEQHNLLLIVADKTLYECSLDLLDTAEQVSLKSLRRITGHVSFVKSGFCLQRVLVCAVKSTVLSTTLRIFEADSTSKNKRSQSLKKTFGGSTTLKIFTELQMPMEALSIHFLKTKLCVGSTKGFDIVSLESAVFQSLLNPADTSFRFLEKKENVRPIEMFRLKGEFLLCYSEFAFFVNTNGWRSHHGWLIHWEGQPLSFALCYPYILGFEPDFIEVRHTETTELVQIIKGHNIKLLTDGRGLISEGGEILYSTEGSSLINPEDRDIVHSLVLPSHNAAGPAL
ncbi:RhoGEF Rgf2 [Schizosaccharomyces cryophilus OY26]|uniref:RhoGEF Rgf2 n=1 Tax=Schizosaccharomyces cryophilus (strain OY26 / ATCC MYA-4695 / CBS 11777 / NBRC 106824 / NRRL Y48691) TaxID=653667 RepID=S9WZV9_SCHCR|nr:RhoGEF Rgf2 [Schizosaccharomyces cryophilus OY26]EPY50252.1 RhoGEF Rgf2 [Schizosaccharomyces cryophilus OY26]